MSNSENYQKLRIIKLRENKRDYLINMGVSAIAIIVTGLAAAAAKNYLPGFLLENFPNSELASTLTKETLERFKDELPKFGLAIGTTIVTINASIMLFIQSRINKIIRQIVNARRPEKIKILQIKKNAEFRKTETQKVKKEIALYEQKLKWDEPLKELKEGNSK